MFSRLHDLLESSYDLAMKHYRKLFPLLLLYILLVEANSFSLRFFMDDINNDQVGQLISEPFMWYISIPAFFVFTYLMYRVLVAALIQSNGLLKEQGIGAFSAFKASSGKVRYLVGMLLCTVFLGFLAFIVSDLLGAGPYVWLPGLFIGVWGLALLYFALSTIWVPLVAILQEDKNSYMEHSRKVFANDMLFALSALLLIGLLYLLPFWLITHRAFELPLIGPYTVSKALGHVFSFFCQPIIWFYFVQLYWEMNAKYEMKQAARELELEQ